MDIRDIIAKFKEFPPKFPRDAISEAIRQKDKIIPELLAIINDPPNLFQKCEQQPEYMGHIYALFLLAQFRVMGTFPLIIAIFGEPSEHSLTLLGDEFVIEDVPRILASVYEGDLSSLKCIIENPSANEYVREAMLKVLLILAIHEKIQREGIVTYLSFLIREKLERTPSILWCGIAKICAELAAGELLEDIRGAFAEDLVDPLYITVEDVEQEIVRGWDRNLKRIATNPHYQLVKDVVREMEWWACFQKSEPQNLAPNFSVPKKFTGKRDQIQSDPHQKTPLKIGRNEPCPCGSGKKYKKCCGKPTLRANLTNSESSLLPKQPATLPVFHECPQCHLPTRGDELNLLCPQCLRQLNLETQAQEGNRLPANTRQSTLFDGNTYTKPRPES